VLGDGSSVDDTSPGCPRGQFLRCLRFVGTFWEPPRKACGSGVSARAACSELLGDTPALEDGSYIDDISPGCPRGQFLRSCSARHSSALFGNRHAKACGSGVSACAVCSALVGDAPVFEDGSSVDDTSPGFPRGQFLRCLFCVRFVGTFWNRHRKRAARGSVRALLALRWSGTRLCLGTVRRLMTPARGVPEVSSCAACSACHSSARFGNRHRKRAARGPVRALFALRWSGTRLCLGTVRRLMTPARGVPEVSSCAACSACDSSARFGTATQSVRLGGQCVRCLLCVGRGHACV